MIRKRIIPFQHQTDPGALVYSLFTLQVKLPTAEYTQFSSSKILSEDVSGNSKHSYHI